MVKTALFLPLASAFALFCFSPLLKKKEAAWIGCLAPLISFLLLSIAPRGDVFIYTFLADPSVSFSLHIDPLATVYGLVITGVGFLIHLFSVGYMEHEEAQPFTRYFAQLNLFIFSMLLLVLSENLLFLFFGWELVGLCSYLLIGFWKDREAPARAAKKAFLTNRFGDIFFLGGLLLIYSTVHSFSFQALFSAPLSFDVKAIIGLLLFIGATGKSAQFPLYIWLPDAMEGPTPVSALIHAATMVTAGVYLILRLFPILDGTETMALIAYGGGLTALYAALVASFQVDLKKVLAFSTISQLGLMFVALGCGGYLFALFHFITHAFFKSLLFLGAGAIMHACSEEQNIFKLGGLAKKMPFVHAAFLCGALALAGIFPFAGFFSKDGILAIAFQKSLPLYLLAQGASLLTAYYTFRMVFYTFYGEYKGKGNPHDPQWVMWLPLSVLGFLSLFGGLLNPPLSFHPLAILLQNVLPLPAHEGGILVPSLSLLFGLLGIAIAYRLFQKKYELSSSFLAGDRLQLLFYAPLYRAGEKVATAVWIVADLLTIDGLVNGVGALTTGLGNKLRTIVSGQLQPYLISISLTMALLLSLLRFYGR